MSNSAYQIWQMERFRTMLWLSAYERMGLKLGPEMVALQKLIKRQQTKIDALTKEENK
jgi:hypothetical protein